ncbi:unnamed protein product, partial [marine sediment metagenome]
LGQDKQRAQQKLDGLRVDDPLLGQAAKIETLRRGVDRYQSARRDLPRLATQRADAVGELDHSLRDLGPGWSKERVTEFDTSLPTREAVRQHQQTLSGSERALHDARGKTRAAKSRLDELVRQRDRVKEAFDDLVAPREADRRSLDTERDDIRRLRSGLPPYHRMLERKRNLRAQATDQEARRQSLQTRLQEKGVTLPLWPLFPAFVLLVAMAGWLLATNVLGLGILVLIVLAAGVGGYLWLRVRLTRSSNDRTKRILEELKTVKGGVEALA